MLLSRIQGKIKTICAILAAVAVMAVAAAPLSVAAQGGPTSTTGIQARPNDCSVAYSQLNSSNCGIVRYVVTITNILSAMVGVIIVISIVWGGIQYSTAKSDPQAVATARRRITNALLALFVYIFMVAFLQWVVPGGVF